MEAGRSFLFAMSLIMIKWPCKLIRCADLLRTSRRTG